MGYMNFENTVIYIIECVGGALATMHVCHVWSHSGWNGQSHLLSLANIWSLESAFLYDLKNYLIKLHIIAVSIWEISG